MDKSEQTKKKLIDAAMSIAASCDCLNAISIRDAAAKAGVSYASIGYHFKNREGFLNALWDSVVDFRRGHTTADFLSAHQSLLETREGQRKFIHDMILDFSMHFRPKNKDEQNRLRIFFNMVFAPGDFQARHIDKFFETDIYVFYDICRRITGRDEPEKSYILFVDYILILAVRHSNLAGVKGMTRSHDFRGDIEKRMRDYAEKVIVSELGIAEG